MEKEYNERTPLQKSVSFDQNHHYGQGVDTKHKTKKRSQSLKDIAQSLTSNEVVISGVPVKPKLRLSPRQPTDHRLVEKDGKRNVRSRHIPRDRYIQDIFTTIVDAKWKWMLITFNLFYLGSWIIFGFLWWLILFAHGEKCFSNVSNFTEALLMSVETSVTIGYGTRQITSECPQAVFLLIIQASLSCFTDAVIMGLIFLKVARPGKRKSTVVFSEKAVVNKKDDKYCLMFGIADVRKRQLAECHVRVHLFRRYKTLEGQVLMKQDQLRVGMDWYNIRDDSDRLFLMTPCHVVHVIDRKSPFYHVSKEQYLASDWEIVVILEGVVEATGCTLQTRTSYLSTEVLWGYDFSDMLNDWTPEEGILYDLSEINNVEMCKYEMPECSAYTFYTRISKDPDPNDVYGEQDELWDDENFIQPGLANRVLPTHKDLALNENNIV